MPPLNFSLEGPGTQACAVCQNLSNLSGNPEEDRAPPCLPWHSPGTGCPLGYLEDTPGGESTNWPLLPRNHPALACCHALNGPTRPQESASTKEGFCGWVASFMSLCCGFRWEGGDCREGRVSGFRGPRHLLRPPSPEEILGAPVVLKGGRGETGRATEHSGSAEDRAELCLNSSRMLFLGPLIHSLPPHRTPEQTALPVTNSPKALGDLQGRPSVCRA